MDNRHLRLALTRRARRIHRTVKDVVDAAIALAAPFGAHLHLPPFDDGVRLFAHWLILEDAVDGDRHRVAVGIGDRQRHVDELAGGRPDRARVGVDATQRRVVGA